MKPFQPNVPQDIQAFLVANFNKHADSAIARENLYRPLYTILYRFINWTYSDKEDNKSYRSASDKKAWEDAYEFFENGEFDMGYEVLRNSDMYKQTYWKRADIPFNPSVIDLMKHSLETL